MVQLGLLILIVAMAGGIAYIGDNVGKKLGKKRLSFFGLRPKHTAALGTLLVGIVISIFTIAAIMASSADVREWWAKGPEAVQRSKEELKKEQDQVKQAEETNKSLEARNAQLSKTFGDLTDRLKKRQADLENAQKSFSSLQDRTKHLQQEVTNLSSKVQQGNKHIDDLNRSVRANEGKLRAVQKQEQDAKSKGAYFEKDNQDILRRNKELQILNDDLKTKQGEAQSELKRLETARSTAQSELNDSQNALNAAQADLAKARSQLSSVKSDLSETEAKLVQAQREEAVLSKISSVARTQPLIYNKQEEVVRLQIRPNLNLTAAKNEILTLIRMARVEAQKKGALDANIYVHYDEAGVGYPPQQIEQKLAEEIIKKPDDPKEPKINQVLIACSTYNAFKGEQVSLEILIMPNPIIYSSGQIIAEAVIDANKGDARMFDEIRTFLSGKVHDKAISEGLIAPVNSDAPLGQITTDDVLKLLERIRKSDRQVRLQIIAQGTIRAGDPLRIEFRIR